MKLAFVGLGNMGLPMAKNLVKAYPKVYGLNRSKGKEKLFTEAGGLTGYTLAELAERVDVIMTCLTFPDDVEQVYLGEDGIINSGRPGLIAIDFSTVSPDLIRKINQVAQRKEISFLDAPVSGGPPGAEAGALSIMVGGDENVFNQVKPILDHLGEHIYHVGPSGAGAGVKLVNQLMVGLHTLAVSEGLILARAFDLPFDKLVDILSNSFAQSRILERHYSQFIDRDDYEPGFALKLLHKDLRLIDEAAEQMGVPLSVLSETRHRLHTAMHSGYGEQDMASMYRFLLDQIED